MATGAGKTGFCCFLMLVILAISQDPNIALAGKTSALAGNVWHTLNVE